MNRMTYQTLRAQMALRGHSMATLSQAIGMKYNTFLRKMRCDSEFTLGEALRIRRELRYQGAVDVLFAQGVEETA
ncbi:MAG: hypothetical protein E7326_04285 [Clostridiales bacterium]|nr:hypothetical protein [Clostridiales bacterium]